MDKDQVKKLRESLGMTQEQFAKIMGVSPRTVSNWETGATIPKGKILHMETLMANAHTFFGGDIAMAGDVTGDNATITNNSNTTTTTTTTTTDDNMAMKALLKSQEQIDRLIGVIERITGTPFTSKQ